MGKTVWDYEFARSVILNKGLGIINLNQSPHKRKFWQGIWHKDMEYQVPCGSTTTHAEQHRIE